MFTKTNSDKCQPRYKPVPATASQTNNYPLALCNLMLLTAIPPDTCEVSKVFVEQEPMAPAEAEHPSNLYPGSLFYTVSSRSGST